jgi:glycerol-3-phosphate acyltransferase PlsY
VWPVYLRFRGGKGVATAAGAVTGIAPAAAGIGFAVFLLVFLPTRYVSLGSICAAVALPAAWAALYWRRSGPDAAFFVLVAIAALVIVKHRANIVRLLRGTEARAVRRKEP